MLTTQEAMLTTQELGDLQRLTKLELVAAIASLRTQNDLLKDENIWLRSTFERGIKWQTVRRESAARLVNEIYHDDEFKTYVKNKGVGNLSRQLVIGYIRSGEMPTTSKFYERARIIRESVLADLAKSSDYHDVDATWNSILTMAKAKDPKRKPIGRRRSSSKSKIVPTIGDSSSRYNGW